MASIFISKSAFAFCVLYWSFEPSETVPSQVWGWLEKSKFLALVSFQNIEIENGFA